MAESSKDVGFVFTWKIENFILCYERGEEFFRSPLFRVEMLGNSEWELWFYPIEHREVVLKLYRAENDKGPEKVTINLESCLFKRNNKMNNKVFGRHEVLVIGHVHNEKHLFSLEDAFTVQCRIWNATTENLVKCFAVTQLSMEKYQVSLPVCYLSDSIYLSSEEILLNSVSKKYPDFKINWTKKHGNVDFKIYAIEPSFIVYVRCEISLLLDCSKRILFEDDHWFKTRTANKVWTLSNIFKSVIPDMKRSGDKSYKMDIKLFASDASHKSYIKSIVYCSEIPESREINQSSSEYLLPKQLEKIYLEEKFSDFTIKSKKKTFKIHKNIFGALSPVFAAMFELNMAEKEDSTVNIDDIDSNILEKLIHYVYAGSIVDMEWDDALKLFVAADKYQMMDLKQSCARILTSKMEAENVIDALILADLHQDEMIMKAAKQLIGENSGEVFRSEMWKTLMENNSKIACEVMHEICIHRTEFS